MTRFENGILEYLAKNYPDTALKEQCNLARVTSRKNTVVGCYSEIEIVGTAFATKEGTVDGVGSIRVVLVDGVPGYVKMILHGEPLEAHVNPTATREKFRALKQSVQLPAYGRVFQDGHLSLRARFVSTNINNRMRSFDQFICKAMRTSIYRNQVQIHETLFSLDESDGCSSTTIIVECFLDPN